ncbi:alpha/beta fold hydrolase [Chthonobacter albigriseus]|uniref:alpha/beta fold hydrolase n=1 Tax=Chthonobacter albigriseus TaxID=1683161 RepID=UPI0015EECEF3|nr:alpha/beta fold hydrolase [Chthonobacter albigriseus]
MSDPVVFVPGLNCTSTLFASQIAALEGERTVIVANHRRHRSIQEIADALVGELPARFVLVGLSMGGYIAFELMRKVPERVSVLVLMDTTARPDSAESKERRERLIGVAEAGRFHEVPGLQFSALVHQSRLGDVSLAGTVRTMAENTGAEVFIRQQTAIMSRVDSRPDLGRIVCPTLVVVGDGDAITPPEVAQEIADGIPGARLATMPVCGHLSSLERPAAVTYALVQFLADVEASR